jgi:hypothetical protein
MEEAGTCRDREHALVSKNRPRTKLFYEFIISLFVATRGNNAKNCDNLQLERNPHKKIRDGQTGLIDMPLSCLYRRAD